jgi:hypothetical protein
MVKKKRSLILDNTFLRINMNHEPIPDTVISEEYPNKFSHYNPINAELAQLLYSIDHTPPTPRLACLRNLQARNAPEARPTPHRHQPNLALQNAILL